MGRAGRALKQVLREYKISQYQLAAMMQVDRSNISRWVSEERDPSAEAVYEILEALKGLNLKAAKAFVETYLGTIE